MSIVLQRRVLARRRPGIAGVVVASLILLVLAVAAVAPTLFTAADPLRAQIADALQAPSAAHPFGTDQAGRDVFARVVHGACYSLLVGLSASALALAAGVVLGVLSGVAPRAVDAVLSRVIVIGMAFPEFLLALIVIAILGPGESSLVAALAIAATPAYARIARSQTLLVRQSGYVRAATALGVPRWRSVVTHVVPNILGPLLVLATIGVGTAIVSAAGLSFLGLGPMPPTPEWGVILSEGRNLLGSAWWVSVCPGIVLTITVIAISVVGRRLQARGARS